jgi:hypothetical protein
MKSPVSKTQLGQLGIRLLMCGGENSERRDRVQTTEVIKRSNIENK